MRNEFMMLCAFTVLVCAVMSFGHTFDETNAVVGAALSRASIYYDNLPDGSPPDDDPPPDTWRGFLGGDTNGWTFAEKKAAFDWFLSTLGTNDCMSLDYFDRTAVEVAVGKCEQFNYTNSVSAMKALALNPRGICRDDAIKIVARFGPINDSTTEFVESVMTNSANYTFRERGRASDQYAWRLLMFDATNSVQREIRDAGVRMFYRNRLLESGETRMADKLFLKYIDGYGFSSNRLMFAVNSFSHPICSELFGDYFTSVTNQLLSSGQPLVQLDIGDGE